MMPPDPREGPSVALAPNSSVPAIACNGCKKLLEESSDSVVVSFGDNLWHVNCRCAKCKELVEHDSHLLLLSDGSPVCENCSYKCTACGLAVSNEAIVTGNDSYHAECFRCRYCDNRIEELIFAKTTQGIYCMSCHNERVSRSRRHAESRRQKSLRRQAREESKQHSRSRSNQLSPQQTQQVEPPSSSSSAPPVAIPAKSASEPTTMAPPASAVHTSTASADNDSILHISAPPPPPASTKPSAINLSKPKTSPPLHSNWQTHHRIPSDPAHRLNQRPSTSDGSPTTTGLRPPSGSHSRQASSNDAVVSTTTSRLATPGGSLLSANLNASNKQSNRRSGFYGAPLGGSPLLRPHTADNTSSPTKSSFPDSEDPQSSHSQDQQQSHELDNNHLPATAPDVPHSPASSNIPLDRPRTPTKAPQLPDMNRHSFTFYDPDVLLFLDAVGSPERPSQPSTTAAKKPSADSANSTDPHNNILTTAAPITSATTTPTPTATTSAVAITAAAIPTPTSTPIPTPPASIATSTTTISSPVVTNAAGPTNTKSNIKSTTTSTSTSRHSPSHPGSNAPLPAIPHETNSPSPSPSSKQHSPQQLQKKLPSEPRTSQEHEESTSTGSSSAGSDEEEEVDEENDDMMRVKRSNTIKKVRESIRKSRVAGGSAFSLNVDLVEMLLADLEETKDKMKSLQTEYTHLRRASRQAYEGFSIAHDEFNKEVAARRQAERQMMDLRDQLKEAAAKLGNLDEYQRKEEALTRRSVELKTDLVGMVEELSSLRVKRDIAYAEVEELSKVENKSSLTPDTVSTGLKARLEKVKEEHENELATLSTQKNSLEEEIRDLRISKEKLSLEESTLREHYEELVRANALAQKDIDSAREKLRQLELAQKAAHRALGYRPPTSTSSTSTGRSPGTATNSTSGHSSSAHYHSSTSSSFEVASATTGFAQAQKAETAAPAIRKFKWGKHKGTLEPHHHKQQQSSISKGPSGSSGGVPNGGGISNGALGTSRSSNNNSNNGSISEQRQHAFQSTSILRPVRCESCGDKMWGRQEYRCAACGIYCHSRCVPGYHAICNSTVLPEDVLPPGPSMFGQELISQAQAENTSVPMIVRKCIDAIEHNGMDFEGVYRKTGGMSSVKSIQNAFDRHEELDLTDRDRFNDLSAVTSVFKNWLRSLPEPLFTFDLHEEFIQIADLRDNSSDANNNSSSTSNKVDRLKTTLSKLPEPHYATLRLLFEHLHRITLQAQENKMTAANLGVVFGPTLLRSRDLSREFTDMGQKAHLCEFMIERAPRLFD